MRIGSGNFTFEWNDEWAKIPDTESSRSGWAHNGAVVTEAGNIITHHMGDPRILIFDRDGNIVEKWDTGISNAHDVVLVKEGDTEYLWLADNLSAQAVKTTLTGEHVMTIKTPDFSAYENAEFKPTSVAVNEERFGGNGDIWITDGYGEFYIHRFDKSGNYMSTLSGEEGAAGRFQQPHGIWIDRRKAEAELYIADRQNHRVQVYDLNGNYKRVFGEDYMVAPSGFINYGDHLIIVEHRAARLTVLNENDDFVTYIGQNEPVVATEGWPNVPQSLIETGKFNSPHGVTSDADGNLYVVEWLVGGRVVKLEKV